jgi:CheY-like chemotaxis protein
VAGDNEDNYAIVERHLSNAGYAVDRAINGRITYKAAEANRYRLILMDIETPRMDGSEASRPTHADELANGQPPVRKPALLETVTAMLAQSGPNEPPSRLVVVDPDLADLDSKYLENCRVGAERIPGE